MLFQNNNNQENVNAKYLCNDLLESNLEDLFKNVDLMVYECIKDIISTSEKYLFHSLFENYIYEIKNGITDDLFINNLKNLEQNFSVEFIDPFNNKDILLTMVRFNNPILKKLLNIIGFDFSKLKDNSFLCLYFEKDNNKWAFPYKTIIINEDGKYEEVKLFNKPKPKDNGINIESKNSLKEFLEGIFDIFKSVIKMFNENNEYIYIPPVYKNKNNKGYYYKLNQVFLREPKLNIKTDQGVAMKVKSKYKSIHQNKLKTESNHFLGK